MLKRHDSRPTLEIDTSRKGLGQPEKDRNLMNTLVLPYDVGVSEEFPKPIGILPKGPKPLLSSTVFEGNLFAVKQQG
jgi:hypothetical protein